MSEEDKLSTEDLKPEYRGLSPVEAEEKMLNKSGTKPVNLTDE